jgi:uncharacterized protein (DUF58 family)
MTSNRRWPLQLFRAASLLWPTGVAWNIVTAATSSSPLNDVAGWALGVLWFFTAAALGIRLVDASLSRRRPPQGEPSKSLRVTWLEAADVLTATGSSLAWCGAGAVCLSAWVGWASLSVVGLLGLGVLHGVAIWTLLRVGGSDPWRRSALTRSFAATRVMEGDPVIEELRFRAPRIPAGFRLLASGRVGRGWALSRYALESAEAGGEVRIQHDVGPARRGEHEAEPLVVWLQDVLGLCHSVLVRAGEGARLTVLPRPSRVSGARLLLGQGGVAEEPRTTERLPTEGSLRLREYAAGDDARRIHWLRSLTRGEESLVVRLPDELPPDEPAVRLVLDTLLRGTSELDKRPEDLTCDAPDVLLDALVRVWLGTGRALSGAGVRVTLVTAVPKDGRLVSFSQPLAPSRRAGGYVPHSETLALAERLGARARWQSSFPVTNLLSKDEPSIIVSHRLPANPAEAAERWIVVPAELWSPFAETPQRPSLGLLPHPIGSADNRWSRRKRDRIRRETARSDHATFSYLTAHLQDYRAGNFVARSTAIGAVALEALR